MKDWVRVERSISLQVLPYAETSEKQLRWAKKRAQMSSDQQHFEYGSIKDTGFENYN